MMSQSSYSGYNQFAGDLNEGVDSSELTMQQQNSFTPYSYGLKQNVPCSFNFGNSGIDTDDLLDLEINGQNSHQGNDISNLQDRSKMSHMYSNIPGNAQWPAHSSKPAANSINTR